MAVLTAEERQLVHAAFMLGPAIFLEKGMTTDEYLAFLSRPAVVNELKLLSDEIKDAQAMSRRRQFMAKRRLAASIPSAIKVLEDALRGPEYMEAPGGRPMIGANGRFIVQRPAPTAQQVSVAEDVLDRLNISSRDKKEQSAFAALLVKMNYGLDQEAAMKLDYEPGLDEEQRRQSRDKLRRAFLAIEPSMKQLMPKIHEAATEVLKKRAKREEKRRHGTVDASVVVPKKKKKKRRSDD